MVERPEPEPDWPRHLCLDKGYDNDTGWGAGVDRDDIPRITLIRPLDQRPTRPKGHQARSWLAERTIAWLHPVSRYPDPLGGGEQLP